METEIISQNNLRLSSSYFELNSTKKYINIIYFPTPTLPQYVNWMLWNTWFQSPFYSIVSNDTDFVENISKIIGEQNEFSGAIVETQYASGNIYLL